jgi:hypothetical protein
VDLDEEAPKPKKVAKKKSPAVSDEEKDPFEFPTKEVKKTKLKQSTINFAKSSVPAKRTTPEKVEKPKKKALTGKKIAIPGIKSKKKKDLDEISDVEETAFDSDEGFAKPKPRAKKATAIKGLSDSEEDMPSKKNRYSIATEESFVDDGADSYEFSD